MKAPSQVAKQAEDHPTLPPGPGERLVGYGVLGLPFASGHVLGLRRWTASSIGAGFTSVWHRDPAGRWTFYESAGAEAACTRYFGDEADQVYVERIDLAWTGERQLRVRTVDNGHVDWSIELGATPMTRLMSLTGAGLPMRAWQSTRVLGALGLAAGRVLRVGTVRLTGETSNGQQFDANPLKIWSVTASHAAIDGEDLGPVGPLAEQAHLADFYFPQRGIFAVGRIFVTPRSGTTTSTATIGRSRETGRTI
ncbi:MAG TPA: hypothetical protein VGK78_01530 [Nocardioides sp.]|uniref:hypothetical protein n=1 Tax=Nocardioides sp. TaxID=35761 RepID=UPI002F413D2E